MHKEQLREEYGYKDNDFIILYIAEFIKRKNHIFLLDAISNIITIIPEVKVILPGKGPLLEEMKSYAIEHKIDKIVNFVGYRKDINKLCNISDLYVTTSHQEGLPISVIEAMASGLPIVASAIRGQTDAVLENRNGYLYAPGNKEELCSKIIDLYKDAIKRKQMSMNNLTDAQKYSVDIAVNKMAKIYKEIKS